LKKNFLLVLPPLNRAAKRPGAQIYY